MKQGWKICVLAKTRPTGYRFNIKWWSLWIYSIKECEQFWSVLAVLDYYCYKPLGIKYEKNVYLHKLNHSSREAFSLLSCLYGLSDWVTVTVLNHAEWSDATCINQLLYLAHKYVSDELWHFLENLCAKFGLSGLVRIMLCAKAWVVIDTYSRMEGGR